MSAVLHRGCHPDVLVAGLARLLLGPPTDPFLPDVVAVHTPGVERYLSQGLARHLGAAPGRSDGVCANVLFVSPSTFVADAMEAVAGIHPGSDPWRPERLAWPVLAAIDEGVGQAWCRPLARHLGRDPQAPSAPDDPRQDRRFALAARVARLFSGYSAQRPEMIEAWARGEDTDGSGRPVPGDLLWQPALWRRVRERLGVPSPAERLEPTCLALADDPGLVDLPERVSVFGPTRLTTSQLRILRSVAVTRDVHLWLTDPSPALWPGPVVAVGEPVTGAPGARQMTSARPANLLLRSLGRDATELRERLAQELAEMEADEATPSGSGVSITDPARQGALSWRGPTLLAELRECLRRDRPLPLGAGERYAIAETDTSIQVHACHGPTRQAEVLREAILGLLSSDESLQPRDILVMCPDLPTMAPLITAAFTDADGRLAGLRLRIADRTPEQGNEVLGTLAAMLDLAPGRMLLSDVLDLVARRPVRTRFGFDEDAVARVEQLAVRAGIRWGLDDRTREAFQLRGVSTSTWAWGLDRMLVGAALSEDDLPLLAGTLPLDDVTTSDLQIIGRLAELLARLTRLRDAALTTRPLAAWVDTLEEAVTGMTAARGDDSWQGPNALAVIAALPNQAGPHSADLLLSLADIRSMLAGALAGRPTRSNFGSGGLTVCGLEPMRSVPHSVVCLVGLDDATYPRTGRRDGDDILGRDRWIGERDIRGEDRQVLLDAILTARDHLIITYTGADDRTNERRPPCVPVSELLDALDGLARTGSGGAAREHVIITHPLQPFDERNFVVGALVPQASFSHDRDAFAGARAARQPRTARPAGLVVPPLPVESEPAHTLAEIVGLLRSPARVFLRERLGLTPPGGSQALPESLPLELDALQKWQIGDRAVRALALGHSSRSFADSERGRGELPPADRLAMPVLSAIGPMAEAITAQLRAARQGPSRLIPVRLDLPSGRTLVGSVPDVHDSGIVRGSYSSPRLKHLALAWPEVLALSACGLSTQAQFTLIGKGDQKRLTSPPQEESAILLDELLALLDAALASPLPLPISTAAAYAKARRGGSREKASTEAARRDWGHKHNGSTIGDVTAWESVLLYGEEAPLEAVMAEAPRPEEAGPTSETSRFGALSRRLWEPILACTQEVS